MLLLGKLREDLGYSYEWTSGQKPCLIKNGVPIQGNTGNYVPIVVPGLSTTSSSSSSSGTTHPTSSPQESTGSTPSPASRQLNLRVQTTKNGETLQETLTKIQKQKIGDHAKELENPSCSEIPEWLQEFRENLVDERVTERRDSHASSSHETSFEPQRRMVPGNHSIETHFPKDRNCEICQRTNMTRSPCRKRTGEVLPRAAKMFVTR